MPPFSATTATVPAADLITRPLSSPELQSRVESNQVLVQDVNTRLGLTEDKVAALEKQDHGVLEEHNLLLLVALFLLHCHHLLLIPSQSLTTD